MAATTKDSAPAQTKPEEVVDEEVPELEEDDGADSSSSTSNKGESKSRKALTKLGLTPFAGVSRVTLRKTKNIIFSVAQPEVFKSNGSDTYVVFGEVKVDDMSNAANNFNPEAAAKILSGVTANSGAKLADTPDDPNEVVDETGISEDDITTVMSQADVSRPKAVKALKANNNSVIDAILSVTPQ